MSLLTLSRCLIAIACLALNTTIYRVARAEDDQFTAMVKQRVQDWQPTKDERLLDQVGWASDLVKARRLAEKHNRPLFVFTYSGSTIRANAIALQRC
ncbi:MAG: hypothetical protein ACI9G1_001304 [Pirellulaceae bacterium]|jgi:hypothetical protein